ncbi:hypothetical protein BGZ76_008465 [Entomortierella beljakovae]|nr:hypothetical protein BGZ76_008465 [Entomortierella beljakovae]
MSEHGKRKHEANGFSILSDLETEQPEQSKKEITTASAQDISSISMEIQDQEKDTDGQNEEVIASKPEEGEEEGRATKKLKIEANDSKDVHSPSNGVEEMSKLDRRKQKKLTKVFARKSQGDGKPCFMLNRYHQKLSIKDVRDLVVYLLTDTKTLPWIMVKNKFNINKVVLLYISGLDPGFFKINPKDPESAKPIAWAEKATTGPVTEFQHLKKFFDFVNVMKAGGDKLRVFSPVDTLLGLPLSNTQKTKMEQETRKMQKDGSAARPESYMLDIAALRENEYPLPSFLDPGADPKEDFVETKQLKESVASKKLIAMDCEMCLTAAGSELTRITMINEEGKTIYDQLVMPDNPITDYLTKYSGMTAERLSGVTTRLVDVQKKLQELVTYDTILIGHSLENDMKVLKFAHPHIIDTSLLYHHTRGPPFRPSLKWLAYRWLSRKIQDGGDNGHDSEEDARACMDLAKLKIKEGPLFGEYNHYTESIFTRIANFKPSRKSAIIDSESLPGQAFANKTIRTNSDAEVVRAVPEAIKDHNLVWCRLRAMEINHGKSNASLSSGSTSDGISGSTEDEILEATEEEVREGVRSIDKSIAEIVESLPENTALIVTSGQGNRREMLRLQARQKRYQRLYNTQSLSSIPKEDQFTDEDQKALEDAVDFAKNGVCFFMVR